MDQSTTWERCGGCGEWTPFPVPVPADQRCPTCRTVAADREPVGAGASTRVGASSMRAAAVLELPSEVYLG